MAFTVNIDLGYELAVKAPYQTVFDLLSDVAQSASHFPKLDHLVDLGDGVYRWEMAKIGIAKYALQTVYTCKYVVDPAKGTLVWTPVQGEGNALVSGNWKIADKQTATHLALHIQAELTMPLPAMVKMIVAPTVQAEFERLVAQYIDNLTNTLDGKV